MKRGVIGVVFIFLLLVTGGLVQADWASYTVEEMSEKADVIVLATIEGDVGTHREYGESYIDWEVTIREYLKNDGQNYEKIIVHTPGVSKRMHVSSIDYNLDYRGRNVILFLQRVDERFTPMTPFGVIGQSGDSFQSTHVPEEEREFLEQLLVERTYESPEEGLYSPIYSQIKRQRLIRNILLVGIPLILLLGYFFLRRKMKKSL